MKPRFCNIVAVCLLVVCSKFASAAPPVIEPAGMWHGKVQDKSLLKLAPKAEFIGEGAVWEKIWTAWRPDEAIPDLDFSKTIVLVGVVDGPNLVIMQPKIDDEGNANFVVGGTKIAGPGFGFKMIAIGREGVKSVNGNPVGGDAAFEGESITVKVVGTLRTGLVAIGGETTGTTITAQGITWELDFGQVPGAGKELEALNEKQVVVQGRLERRAGVEIPVRWIVNVSDIELAE